MLRTIVSIIAGAVAGIAVGATLVAPRLAPKHAAPAQVTTTTPRPKPTRPVAPKPVAGVPSIRWTLTSAIPAERPHMGDMVQKLDQSIWRLSDGAFEIRPGEDDDDSGNLYTAIAAGARDVAFTNPAQWHERIPALQLFTGIPFGPMADTFLAWFYSGGGQSLYEGLHQRHGVHGMLCGMTVGNAAGWFRQPIKTVGDLNGLNIRINGLGADILSRLGAKPVTMAEIDVPGAFDSGSLDAAVLGMPSIDARLALEKVAKHYYFPSWQGPFTAYELIVNQKKWDALPVIDQDRLRVVCGDNVRHGLAETGAEQFDALKTLQKRGVDIRRLPPGVIDALRTAWKATVDDMSAHDPDFKKIWASLTQFQENYAIYRDLSRL